MLSRLNSFLCFAEFNEAQFFGVLFVFWLDRDSSLLALSSPASGYLRQELVTT